MDELTNYRIMFVIYIFMFIANSGVFVFGLKNNLGWFIGYGGFFLVWSILGVFGSHYMIGKIKREKNE